MEPGLCWRNAVTTHRPAMWGSCPAPGPAMSASAETARRIKDGLLGREVSALDLQRAMDQLDELEPVDTEDDGAIFEAFDTASSLLRSIGASS